MTTREHVIDYVERETGGEVVSATPDCDGLVWQVGSTIGDLWVITRPGMNVYDVDEYPFLPRALAEHRRICEALANAE